MQVLANCELGIRNYTGMSGKSSQEYFVRFALQKMEIIFLGRKLPASAEFLVTPRRYKQRVFTGDCTEPSNHCRSMSAVTQMVY